MVLPPPAADDASRARESGWLRPLKRALRLSRAGVLLLVDKARPQSLGELVRALLPEHPGLEVYTEARQVVEAEPGSALVLVPRPEEADWLNLNRPLFAHRALRVVLFCDAETTLALARQAVDFFDWISHHVECPSQPPRHAVEGLRCALAVRVPGIVWTGGDLEASFAATRPGRRLHRVSAARPYPELVAEVRAHRRDWLAWSDVDGPFRLRRVRWALAEARRRTKAILVEPDVESPGWWKLHGRVSVPGEARERLEKAGARHPGRLAALTGLEPEAVELVAELLGQGVEGTALEAELLRVEDPGAAVGRMAVERGHVSKQALVRGEAPAPVLRAWAEESEQRRELRRLREAERADIARRFDGTGPLDAEEVGWWAAWTTAPPSAELLDRLTPRGKAFAAETCLRTNEPAAWGQAASFALDAGDPDAAEGWAQRATNAGIHFAADVLAMIRLAQGYPQKAKSALQESPFPVSSNIAAGVSAKLGESSYALELLYQQLAAVEKEWGREHSNYAATLHNLASIQANHGQFPEAEATARQAIAIKERILGPHHPSLANSLNTLAIITTKQGRFSEAEALHLQALSILKSSKNAAAPDYAFTLNDLALTISKQGRYSEAQKLFSQALKIQEESLGKSSPRLCPTLTNLGHLLVQQGHAAEGEGLIQRALDLAFPAQGPHGYDVAHILSLLARSQALQDKPEARETARQALEALHHGLGPEHPTTRSFAPTLQAILDGVPRSSPPES